MDPVVLGQSVSSHTGNTFILLPPVPAALVIHLSGHDMR